MGELGIKHSLSQEVRRKLGLLALPVDDSSSLVIISLKKLEDLLYTPWIKFLRSSLSFGFAIQQEIKMSGVEIDFNKITNFTYLVKK